MFSLELDWNGYPTYVIYLHFYFSKMSKEEEESVPQNQTEESFILDDTGDSSILETFNSAG